MLDLVPTLVVVLSTALAILGVIKFTLLTALYSASPQSVSRPPVLPKSPDKKQATPTKTTEVPEPVEEDIPEPKITIIEQQEEDTPVEGELENTVQLSQIDIDQNEFTSCLENDIIQQLEAPKVQVEPEQCLLPKYELFSNSGMMFQFDLTKPDKKKTSPTRAGTINSYPYQQVSRIPPGLVKRVPEEPECNLWIGGICKQTREREFSEFLSSYGNIVSLSLISDAQGIPKGFAYVTFTSMTSYTRLLESPVIWNSDKLTVKLAIPKEKMNSNKAHVSRIPECISSADLKKYFSDKYGSVEDVVLKEGKHSNFGFVRFSSVKAMQSALLMSTHHLKGRKFYIEEARKSGERSSSNATNPDIFQRRLWIGGISKNMTLTQLEKELGLHGELENLCIVSDDMGRSKGFSYATFKSESDVASVLAMPELTVAGIPVTVKRALPESVMNKHKVYVRGLSLESSRESILKYFRKFGNALEVILKDSGNKRFAFVRFGTISLII